MREYFKTQIEAIDDSKIMLLFYMLHDGNTKSILKHVYTCGDEISLPGLKFNGWANPGSCIPLFIKAEV